MVSAKGCRCLNSVTVKYKTFGGRDVFIKFASLEEACSWLRVQAVVRDIINAARKIKEGYLKELKE
jgi:hypothetical protein